MRNCVLFLSILVVPSSLVLACSGAGVPFVGGDGGSGSSSGASSSSGSGGSSGVSGGSSGGGSGGGSGSGSGGSSGSSSSGGGSGSGSGGSSSGGGSGSSSGGACNPTLPDAGACNSLAPSLSPVALQCVPGSFPQPQGGNIVNGQYLLATATYYGSTCPTPEVDRDRWLVCGTTWQTLQDYTMNGGMEMSTADNFNVTQNGTSLQLQGVCGVTAAYSFGYSATPTTISLYIPTPNVQGEGRVDVYTLQ